MASLAIMPMGWETKAHRVWGLVPSPTVEIPRFSSTSRSNSASTGSWVRMSAISVSNRPSYCRFWGWVKLVSQLFSKRSLDISRFILARSSASCSAAINRSGPPSLAQWGSPMATIVPE